MDVSEKIAEEYLQTLNRGMVVFEPDGNIPPDFSLNGEIGVEVRRLNQNHEQSNGETKGLEEIVIPTNKWLERFLPTLGPSVGGECWYVWATFHRPIGSWEKIQSAIKQFLREFMQSSNRTPSTRSITENFKVNLMLADRDHGKFFVFTPSMDYDAGGWMMCELERNLRICLEAKGRKIEISRAKYAEWWLVLVDHIGYYYMDPEDRNRFLAEFAPRLEHQFDKVILLDPRNHRRAVEI